jgi:hypothetical protein
MPSTLGHIAVQGLLTRPAFPRLAARWILLGAVLPDLPWIFKRITRVALPSLDPYDARLYFLIQASLVFCLLLAGALAALSRRPRVAFACLGVSSLLHLLTDATQIKWGVGVHLLAPLTWEPLKFGLFWPESLPAIILSLIGVVVVAFEWRRPTEREWGLPVPGGRKAAAVAMVTAYLLLPLVFMIAAEAPDNHMVATLRDIESRPGKLVELDRVVFRPEDGGYVKLFSGERLRVVGELPGEPRAVSIRGRFLDARTVQVQEMHGHFLFWRDAASYVGLLLVASIWVRDWRRSRNMRRTIPQVAIPRNTP